MDCGFEFEFLAAQFAFLFLHGGEALANIRVTAQLDAFACIPQIYDGTTI
ncbi:MAG TPA: hypothetical protein VGR78_08280 [Verrucomicrobiae bacterium]|jgi:hypothetical protein|nr:hypothetical protein [Verrucomicrobiae bacterium]